MRCIRLISGILAAMLFWAAPEALAAPAGKYSISATPLNFGNGYNPSSDLTANSSVTISWNKLPPTPNFTVTANAGQSGSYIPRRMTDGAGNFLDYNLYLDAVTTQVWGDPASNGATVAYLWAGSPPLSGNPLSTTVTVYAKVPAGQNVFSGTYTDTVVFFADWGAPNASRTNMNISLTLLPSVTVFATPLNFGSAITGDTPAGTSAITVNGTPGTLLSISLDDGLNGVRNLRDSFANLLPYDIYTDAAYSTRWGTPGSVVTTTATGANQLFTAYGRLTAPIPVGAYAGSYSDVVQIIVTY